MGILTNYVRIRKGILVKKWKIICGVLLAEWMIIGYNGNSSKNMMPESESK
ncbi:MAG: hypothetical protein RHS_2554 [Robinsoniella sp. RHS]|nr:MAG: hypothetical protein RHS_2554 [Robinsoniella sp. RHS]